MVIIARFFIFFDKILPLEKPCKFHYFFRIAAFASETQHIDAFKRIENGNSAFGKFFRGSDRIWKRHFQNKIRPAKKGRFCSCVF